MIIIIISSTDRPEKPSSALYHFSSNVLCVILVQNVKTILTHLKIHSIIPYTKNPTAEYHEYNHPSIIKEIHSEIPRTYNPKVMI